MKKKSRGIPDGFPFGVEVQRKIAALHTPAAFFPAAKGAGVLVTAVFVADTGRQDVSLVEDLKQPDKGEGCDAMEGFIIRALRMASDYSPPYPWGSSRE